MCAAVLTGHVLLGSLAAQGAGQRSGDEAADSGNIDDVVTEALTVSGAPGAIVAVVVRDSVGFLRAYGRARLSEDAPLDPGALFRVGAATQLINGLAAAAMAQEGTLQLDGALGGLVPELPEALHEVTLAQLLSHTAGIAYVPAAPGRGGDNDLGAAARQLTHLDRFAEPGAIYSPSLSGVSLAGYAIERAGASPYAEVIQATVFRPLRMETATLDFRKALPLMAIGYARSMSAEQPINLVKPEPDSTLVVPRRGLIASVHDLARLAAALMNDGVVDGAQALPPGSVATVLAPIAAIPGSDYEQSALGVQVTRWEGRREIRVAGGGGGHGFLMRLLPDHRLGVIVLTNMSGVTLSRVSEFVFRRMLDVASAAPMAAQSPPDRAYDDLYDLVGTYSNGGEEIELLVEGQRLALRSGDFVLEVTENDGTFRARIPDGRPALAFRIVHDAGGRAYLWANGRALARRMPDPGT